MDSKPSGQIGASAEFMGQEQNPHQRVRGECRIFLAYDVGLAIDLNQAEQRIAAGKARETMRKKRRSPSYFEFDPPPLRVSQKIEPLKVAHHRSAEYLDAMIYDFGAISVAYTFPLDEPLDKLLHLSEHLYDNELLLSHSRRIVEELLQTIEPAVNKPRISELVEDYAVYQIKDFETKSDVQKLLKTNSQLMARILRAESESLSAQEVGEALSCRLSYSGEDEVIIDWNAAVIFDQDASDVLAVLEYTNVELVEMRFLDDQLDDALEESYQALGRREWGRRLLFRSASEDLRKVAELQMDGALLFEGVHNALKLLGDQYLARMHRSASRRMHLDDWERTILRKLHTIESIYEKMSSLQETRRMEALEWVIIILIAISIILPFIPGVSY
jgi:hypothetical protein